MYYLIEIVIIRLNRLGWTQEHIADVVGVNQQRVSQITNNANFIEIGNLISQGRDMDYIARHYHMDLALAWALRLEGKTDQEKFKELGWGLCTWDQWNFNECLPREIPGDSKAYFTGVMNASLTIDLPAIARIQADTKSRRGFVQILNAFAGFLCS